MKVTIEADSPEEFESKRADLIKALAKKVRAKTIYDLEKPAIEPRRAKLASQNDVMDLWNEKFKKMVKDIKREISDVIG